MGCRKLQIQDFFTLRTSQSTLTTYTYAHENHEKHLTKIDKQLLVHIQTLLKILSGICELRTNAPIFNTTTYTYDAFQDNFTTTNSKQDALSHNKNIQVNDSTHDNINYIYDYQVRKFKKTASIHNGTSWVVNKTAKFAYDQWNLIGIFDASDNLTKSFLHGEEGILAETDEIANNTYLALRDGNRNIMGYVNASDGAEVANYEYSPFGKMIVKTGTKADDMTFRFSRHVYDTEIDLVYYGYRYYDADMGRWINRDPIEEDGGANVYGFVRNDGINDWDYLGREAKLANGKNDSGGKYVLKLVTENGKDFIVKIQGNVAEQKAVSDAAKGAISRQLTNSKSSICTRAVLRVGAIPPHRASYQSTINALAKMEPGVKTPISKGAITQGVLDVYTSLIWATGGEQKLFVKFHEAYNNFKASSTNANCHSVCETAHSYVAGVPGTGIVGGIIARWYHLYCACHCNKNFP